MAWVMSPDGLLIFTGYDIPGFDSDGKLRMQCVRRLDVDLSTRTQYREMPEITDISLSHFSFHPASWRLG